MTQNIGMNHMASARHGKSAVNRRPRTPTGSHIHIVTADPSPEHRYNLSCHGTTRPDVKASKRVPDGNVWQARGDARNAWPEDAGRVNGATQSSSRGRHIHFAEGVGRVDNIGKDSRVIAEVDQNHLRKCSACSSTAAATPITIFPTCSYSPIKIEPKKQGNSRVTRPKSPWPSRYALGESDTATRGGLKCSRITRLRAFLADTARGAKEIYDAGPPGEGQKVLESIRYYRKERCAERVKSKARHGQVHQTPIGRHAYEQPRTAPAPPGQKPLPKLPADRLYDISPISAISPKTVVTRLTGKGKDARSLSKPRVSPSSLEVPLQYDTRETVVNLAKALPPPPPLQAAPLPRCRKETMEADMLTSSLPATSPPVLLSHIPFSSSRPLMTPATETETTTRKRPLPPPSHPRRFITLADIENLKLDRKKSKNGERYSSWLARKRGYQEDKETDRKRTSEEGMHIVKKAVMVNEEPPNSGRKTDSAARVISSAYVPIVNHSGKMNVTGWANSGSCPQDAGLTGRSQGQWRIFRDDAGKLFRHQSKTFKDRRRKSSDASFCCQGISEEAMNRAQRGAGSRVGGEAQDRCVGKAPHERAAENRHGGPGTQFEWEKTDPAPKVDVSGNSPNEAREPQTRDTKFYLLYESLLAEYEHE